MQAGFKADQVQVVGRFSDYTRISDEADRKEHAFHFCPDCGSQVFGTEPTEPDLIVVSVGSFADPSFPPPTPRTTARGRSSCSRRAGSEPLEETSKHGPISNRPWSFCRSSA